MALVTVTVGQDRAADLAAVLGGDADGDVVSVTGDFDAVAAAAHEWGFSTTTDVSVTAEGRGTQALTFDRPQED